jgi:secreted Zn-dependent insulinase-like peptidase
MEAEAESKLKEGLDRFGSFFSSPLFTESATGRELNAIESENSKNLQVSGMGSCCWVLGTMSASFSLA